MGSRVHMMVRRWVPLFILVIVLAVLVAVSVVCDPRTGQAQATYRVQVTFYNLGGFTRSETPVREGVAACDPNVFPLGSVLRFVLDGRVVVCEDTGSAVVGYKVDIWSPYYWHGVNTIEAVYYPHCNFNGGYTCADVEVLRWGW